MQHTLGKVDAGVKLIVTVRAVVAQSVNAEILIVILLFQQLAQAPFAQGIPLVPGGSNDLLVFGSVIIPMFSTTLAGIFVPDPSAVWMKKVVAKSK